MKRLYLSWILAAPLLAQIGTDGSIVGVVVDPSGAATPGARVAATNTGTGLHRTVLSDKSGGIEILPLPKGTYKLEVSASGFRNLVIENISLNVGEIKRVPVRLEVGQVNQITTVEAKPEVLQTDKSSVDTVIEERRVKELPLNGRDPIELVGLAPGVRYGGKDPSTLDSTVTALGSRNNQTDFRLDGLNSNTFTYDYGGGFPNVDMVAEFNVQTSNFGAENGRDPVVVSLVTKGGTNQFHGSVWEFLRNNALDARNTFATRNPKLNRNQFGGTLGGPVIRNKTFFFFSYEGLRVRQEVVQNFVVPSDNQLNGIFPKAITDPVTQQPFPNNTIPKSRFNSSSAFFFPYILRPNSPGDFYRNVVPNPTGNNQYSGRIDQQITAKQRIYGRVISDFNDTKPAYYSPAITDTRDLSEYNIGINYDYTVTPHMIITVGASTFRYGLFWSSPILGKENFTQEAGIQGFPTAGREAWIGLPNSIAFSGYQGISTPSNTPETVVQQSVNGNASISLIHGNHTITTGYQYLTWSDYARHGSGFSRGSFTFNGQYTGDGFADYLLGDLQGSLRNYPLQTFGVQHMPYHALFVQDNWKVTPKLTLELGLRFDFWGQKAFVRGAGGTFSTSLGKAVAAENKNGQVDLTAQVVSPYLAAATAGLWVPASQAHLPRGLFQSNGIVAPRLGFAWRPFSSTGFVIRAAYGLFASNFDGNSYGSAIISPPYWAYESQTWGRSQLQNWQTAWPAVPTQFVAPSIYAQDPVAKAMKTHEWNISVQKTLPAESAVTVSYIGSNSPNLLTGEPINVVAPGNYTSLQAALPYPAFGGIYLYRNIASATYNAGILKWEKRYSKGLASTFNYAFSKNLGTNNPDGLYNFITPFAPQGYNHGRSLLDHTHIISASLVWDIPYGRGRRYGSTLPTALNILIGGWELTGIYAFSSGNPLSITVPGSTLGNGYNTRANVTGDPGSGAGTPGRWFNPDAFSAPALYAYGNSGIGIIDGPGTHSLYTGLLKNFAIRESKYLQFRWELFNAPNHVNYSDPNVNLNQSSTGRILSAGSARTMQLALKLQF